MVHKEIIQKTLAKIPGVSEEEADMTTDSLVYAIDISIKEAIKDMATKDDIKDMATKADIKDIESRMATKADIKDIESRMATKADIKDIESRMATKDDIKDIESRMATKDDIKDMATKRDIDGLRVEIAERETRMVKQQMINAGVIIGSISFIMLLIEFFT